MSKKPSVNLTEMRGVVQLLSEATIRVSGLAQESQDRITHPPAIPSTPVQKIVSGISGFVYGSIQKTTKLIGSGLDVGLQKLGTLSNVEIPFHHKETLFAVLNGIIGDYMEAHDNQLTIPMQFRKQGKGIAMDRSSIASAYPEANGKIMINIHGLCMNDLQWSHKGHHHGELLAKEFGFTQLSLHYNTGRHISLNGQALNLLLEDLIAAWPVAVEEIVIVAHSMGGLISRSALHYAASTASKWPQLLHKLIFLGSPHHGAPLEQIGNYVDRVLDSTLYTKPFSRIGKVRSAGITDLRQSFLVDEDWQDKDRFAKDKTEKRHIPLPQHVKCYAVAACIARKDQTKKIKILGDGLVMIESALGQHRSPNQTLHFQEANTQIVYQTDHLHLLSNLDVYKQLKTWMAQP